MTDQTWDEIRPIKSITSSGGYSFVGAINPQHILLSCNHDHCYEVAKKPDDIYHTSDRLPPFLFSEISKEDGYNKDRDCPMDILVDPVPYDGGVVDHGMIERIGIKNH